MKNFFSVAGGIALASVLAGCSATGGNGGGGTPPIPPQSPLQNYSAVTLNGAGTTQSAGTIFHNGTQLTVDVGGQTYTANGGTHGGLLANTSLDQYAFNGPGNQGYLLAGQHVQAGALIEGGTAAHFAVNGTETLILPTQTANYVGGWMLTDGTNGAEGIFDAAVNFDAGNINFLIYDNQPMAAQIGTGTGTLQANGFVSTFNTTGTITSTNNVDGQFYGPNAEELAGLIQGTSGGNPTAGFMIGKQ